MPGDTFTPYGPSHVAVLVVLAALAWWLVRRGRAARGTRGADRLSAGFALVFLALTLPLQVYFNLPGRFDVGLSLPIQLCDLAWLAAIHALLTRRRWSAALTFYWGITLSIQPILTPDLDAEFPDPAFILYWSMHGMTVVAAIFLTWGLGIRPGWDSYRVAVTATAVWAVTVFTFNVAADTNYGFLNAKPDSASVLDLFGPWPWYVVVETVLIAAVWALITWPWTRRTPAGRAARGRRPAPLGWPQ
ncbi:TIGR02206 family membrane protein [Jiangella aurantiaca]|uniref:TIGR02206 family membrane protein n=1 Tax=Jiangella aurantiaca TaxID=2530373 RepID=A0A4R5AJQ2_9ACTN|nr:TIGR02206 family membrane protein [Jiangella aurantiaca]TDD72015.1 TIGR02206 family membrane protein [Jiangella aurantiaca]